MVTFLFLIISSLSVAKPSFSEQKEFIGRMACHSCHAEQNKAWQGSHHDLAMEEANSRSVLGNFNNVKSNHFGVISTFFKRGGKFMVNTDGSDGALHDYQIKLTKGNPPALLG